jgi:hypothetical protein
MVQVHIRVDHILGGSLHPHLWRQHEEPQHRRRRTVGRSEPSVGLPVWREEVFMTEYRREA